MGSPLTSLVTLVLVGGSLAGALAGLLALTGGAGPAPRPSPTGHHPVPPTLAMPVTGPHRRDRPVPPARSPDARTAQRRCRLNVTTVAGEDYLRVTLQHGDLLHLAPRALPGVARRAPAPTRRWDAALDQYDPALLAVPAWTERTMCGLPWRCMADDAAEVDAVTASLTRDRLPNVSVCPVCARQVLTPDHR